jgi:hypothetical protein
MNREDLRVDLLKVIRFVEHQVKMLEIEEKEVLENGLELLSNGHKPDRILEDITAKLEEWHYLEMLLKEEPEIFCVN